MLYVYDILLNFKINEIIDFFDWDILDDIYYVKKIPIFRVNSKLIKDLFNKKVVLDELFVNKIFNKTDYKSDDKNKDNYLCLLSDAKNVIGIKLQEDGELIGLSVLLPEDEIEVLTIVDQVDLSRINYYIKKDKNLSCNFLTRNESKIQKNLINEIENLYTKNEIDKLSYYYYECFNMQGDSKDDIYKELMSSIVNNFNIKHVKLYELIKLSYQDSK